MKSNAKLLLAVCLLGAARPASSQAKDPITGVWSGYIGRSEATPASAEFEMKLASNGSVSGRVSGTKIQPGEITSGSFDAKTGALKLAVAVKASDGSGKGGMVSFDGRVSHDTASGKMMLGEENGVFQLTRNHGKPMVGVANIKEDAGVAAAKRGFVEVSGWISRAAEMVPAEKYSYRPVSTVRTFGELIAHVVDGSNYYCGKGLARTIEWSDATEKKVTGKTAIVAALKQAFADCNAAYAEGKVVGPLMENVAHSSLHYGNIVTYLRMMGMVPPSS